MDFNFTEDQDQLRDAVRKWVDRSYGFERRRAITQAGGFDRAAYGELAELGLTGLYIAEEHGSKSMVPVGDQADAFIVPAMAGEKAGLFLVERAAEGVAARGYGTQDGGRAAEVTFNKSPATLIVQDGLQALEHGVDVGIAAACA